MTFVEFSNQGKVENLFSFSLSWNVSFFLLKKTKSQRGACDFKLVKFHGCEKSKQPMNTKNLVKFFLKFRHKLVIEICDADPH